MYEYNVFLPLPNEKLITFVPLLLHREHKIQKKGKQRSSYFL